MPTGIFIRTEEHKRNISQALKGRPRPWQEKEKIKITCPCGTKLLLTPGRIREGHGKYCSRNCTYKYRDNSKFLSLIIKKGQKNQNWRGDAVGYKAFHLRVNQLRGKAYFCEENKTHQSTRFEWANLNGNYEDIYDYKSLCKKCHNEFDNVVIKGWETRRGGDVLA